MSKTKDYTVTQGAWTDITDGSTDRTHVTVQLKSPGPVLVHVTSAGLPLASAEEGFLLSAGEDELVAVPLAGLVAGDSVYCRSVQDEDNLVCAFLAGAEPV